MESTFKGDSICLQHQTLRGRSEILFRPNLPEARECKMNPSSMLDLPIPEFSLKDFPQSGYCFFDVLRLNGQGRQES